ncbi:MAG: hypothetical protein OCC45_03720 [Desulfotalea sp.]
MKNKEFMQCALKYLFMPEDSSGGNYLASQSFTTSFWSSNARWLGVMKTLLWAVLAIVLPIVLIRFSS